MTPPKKSSDQKLAERPTVTQQAEPLSPIGVPPGYVAPGDDLAYFEAGGRGPIRPTSFAKPVQFYEGADWEPASRAPDRIAELQQAMADAGVLKTKYRKGVWDDESRAAYRDVLSHANATGLSPEQSIARWADGVDVEAEGEARTFDPLPFRPPDPAAIRQSVKRAFKDILPRDLRESEIDYLTSQAEAMMRQEHESKEGARRAEFDAAGTGRPGAAVPEVDAESRFRELLETRYKPQMDLVAAQDENVETRKFVGQSLRNMSSIIGGASA